MRDEWFIRGKVPMTKKRGTGCVPFKAGADARVGSGRYRCRNRFCLCGGGSFLESEVCVGHCKKTGKLSSLLRQNIARAERAGAGTIHLLDGGGPGAF